MLTNHSQQKRITQTIRQPKEEDKVESKLADAVDTKLDECRCFHVVMMILLTTRVFLSLMYKLYINLFV